MFQEFPKMLYQGDANTIVADAEQEKDHRADGWHDFGQDPAQPKARGKKHAEPADGAGD